MKTKQLLYTCWAILMIGVSFGITSCDDAAVARGDETDSLPYIFRPAVFKSNMVGNTTTVELSWAAVTGANSYTIEIYSDSLAFNPSNLVARSEVTNLIYSIELAGSTTYSARIRANADTQERDSKWNSTITFKTPSENLFNGYTVKMVSKGTVQVNWLPGSNVTRLLFTDQTSKATFEFPISSEEKATGSKSCSGIPNGVYVLDILNNSIIRGETVVTLEGDIFLSSGDDLKAAMDNAQKGSTIVLNPGVYNVGAATYKFDRNIKLKGIDSNNRAVVCMATGTGTPPTATSSMFNFTEGAVFDYLRFENIDFTGMVDNSSTGTKIGYMFNNNTIVTVNQEVSFKNCLIHNIGNTPLRLQANKNQLIGSVIFDGCIINDIGFASTYAIVNVNTATDLINNIIFRNSTIYNFSGSLVLRQSGTVNQVIVENCTVNQGMMNTASARFFIDLNSITNTASVTISNCILGETASTAGGIRPLGDYPISGCYYTSDYVDDALVAGASSTIKPKMKAYSQKSTDLWTKPSEGIFTFKDATFVGKATAGDPRWR